MIINDMGQKLTPMNSELKKKSLNLPIKRLQEDVYMTDHFFNINNRNLKTHGVYDSVKHVMHNRNHTAPGVGRHS